MAKIIHFEDAKAKLERRKATNAFHRFHYVFNEDVIHDFWDFVGENVQEKIFLQFFQLLKGEPLISIRARKRFFLIPVLEVETSKRKLKLKYSSLKGFEILNEEAKVNEASNDLDAGSPDKKTLS